jgi:type IX secretion system PorP/SprF family membrane protein
MLSKLQLLLLLTICAFQALAQDPQLSQYYNAPLYLNPAFAGTAENTRAVLNYRSQWTSLPSPYVTFAASFDHFIGPYNSGVGLLVKRDRQGDAGLNSTDVNLIYSYQVYLGEGLTFIPAIQAGFVNRDLNYSNLIFGDQVTNNGIGNSPSVDNFAKNGSSVSFLDVGAGGLLYSDHFWLGYSGNHFNKPNVAFSGDSRLPVKSSFHGGYKFFLQKPAKAGMYSRPVNEKSISPTFMYKMQGLYDQFDLGLYLRYDPLMFGLWYRGLPIKKYKEGINNHEALILMAGIHYEGLAFAYSYDLTISTLKPGSGGSHEVSLIYQWEIPYKNYKKKKRARKVSCPSFYR